jgi:hypothetical protein
VNLRLFKEPYIDPLTPDRIRLLFERDDGRAAAGERDDFYIYVWIKNGALVGFQAILNDEHALEFHEGRPVSFGRVRVRPIDRSIHRSTADAEYKRLIDILENISNKEFPNMMRGLSAIAFDARHEGFELTSVERTILRDLFGNIAGGTDAKDAQ